MQRAQRPVMILAIGVSLFSAAAASAQTDIDVTMTVFDSVADVDVDLLVDARPADDRYEEDLFDLDNDGIPDDREDETGLFDQYRELDAEFEIADENDGFELDDVAHRDWREFASEDDFEENEKLDNDEYDLIEEPVDPA
jgi:hypothetical protein